MSNPLTARKNLSRIGKLMALTGFGSAAPYISGGKGSKSMKGINAMNSMAGFQTPSRSGQSPETMMTEWRDMASYSAVSAAIRVVVDEAVQSDSTAPAVLWAEGGDSETEALLNEFIQHNLKVEDVIRSQFWWVYVQGNNFEKLILGPDGVHGWKFTEPSEITRVTDENSRLVGFRSNKNQPSETEGFAYGSGDRVWKPWDYIHMRTLAESRESEYGISMLDAAVDTFNRLRKSEDMMVAYRLNMQPSRYKLKVDTGTGSRIDQAEIVNEWRNYLRSSRVADPMSNRYEQRYEAQGLDDLIILPVHKESVTDIDKIEGDHEVPDITDVQYHVRQLAGILNVPPEYIGVKTEGASVFATKNSLAQQDIRFQRSIKALRMPIQQSYDKVCRIHLAMIGKDPFTPFRIKMSNIAATEAESQLEIVSAQADLVDKMITLGNNIDAPREEWIRMVFTKFLPLPPEMVDIVAIGNAMTTESPHEELPSTPNLDSLKMDTSQPDAAPPGQESARRRAIHKASVLHLHERLRHKASAQAYYAERYKTPLAESKITEARKLITEAVSKPKLMESSRALRVAFSRVVKCSEGYTPDIREFTGPVEDKVSRVTSGQILSENRAENDLTRTLKHSPNSSIGQKPGNLTETRKSNRWFRGKR